MRIGIVNDMRLASEALRRVVGSMPGHEVIWTAVDGAEAADRAARDRPDLILMDLIMPRVDGAEATRRIMRDSPCAILVVTSSVTGNIAKVYEAMGHGALDAVDTPVLGVGGKLEGAQALLHKIGLFEKLLNKPGTSLTKSASSASIPTSLAPRGESAPGGSPRPSSAAIPTSLAPRETASAPPPPMPPAPGSGPPPQILLGASTGGPKVLAQILAALPRTSPACVIIVQHVDAAFASGLATWLGQQSRMPVQLVPAGQEPQAGQVFLAQTGDHLILTPTRRLNYTPEPRDQCFRPSVDVFFNSVARHWNQPGVAVLLTGMGRDGAEGLLALRRAGWHTMAQDSATSTVYGMPKAAAELGAAAQVLTPAEIAQNLVARLARTRPAG
jgi:two-component system response regulator WspF